MPAKKETLTEEERCRRIQETAELLGTDDDPKAFDRAFEKIIPPASRPKPQKNL
jgi:hypothetical protein